MGTSRLRPIAVGTRFGRLVTTGEVDRTAGRTPRWVCICDCGQQAAVDGAKLRGGKARSCGCVARAMLRLGPEASRRHGSVGTREYHCWSAMIQRCLNTKNPNYPNYGARGITVCDRWRDFAAFAADMGPCPVGLTIDRIDNARGYEPGNCRWATYQQQNRNLRRNRLVTWQGKTLPLVAWCEQLGVPYDSMRWRLRYGWSVEEAFTTPLGATP